MSWVLEFSGGRAAYFSPLFCFRLKCGYATLYIPLLKTSWVLFSEQKAQSCTWWCFSYTSQSSELERHGDTHYTNRRWANCQWDEMILQMLTGERVLKHDYFSSGQYVRRIEAGFCSDVQTYTVYANVCMQAHKHVHTRASFRAHTHLFYNDVI